ncbi:dihydrodipicolinate synthase family protein [Streptomyces enissocaesilis]|uniref:4-hydroxy-tetrahydrodipicolinate synthase n=1 Tax=Streptomyces enissocaesilis TaxID=332589 RepID=A0ABP6K8W6_9ACTN
MSISGANTLLVTPFKADGELDLKSLGDLTEFVISGGVHGVMALGSSGEFFTLSWSERVEVMKHIADVVGGRVPLTLGVGADSTAACVELIQAAESCGADCALVLPPLYFDQSPHAQALHFTTVARAADIPVMIYDGAGGVAVPPSVIAAVRAEAPNVQYVKQATPEPHRTREILDLAPGVLPLAGDDTLLLTSLRNGAVGSSTAIGNVLPQTISRLHEEFDAGNVSEATELYTKLMPAVLATSAPKVEFIARLKVLLNAMGVITNAHVRSPLRPLDDATRGELLEVASHLKLL